MHFKFDLRAGLIVVNVIIKADVEATAKLVVDTGASYVLLPWRLTRAIGLRIDPTQTIQTTTATAVETVPEVIIPEVKALGKTVKNVKAMVKDLPPESPVDGLLGLSFLRHFRLNIDFKKGELKLE